MKWLQNNWFMIRTRIFSYNQFDLFYFHIFGKYVMSHNKSNKKVFFVEKSKRIMKFNNLIPFLQSLAFYLIKITHTYWAACHSIKVFTFNLVSTFLDNKLHQLHSFCSTFLTFLYRLLLIIFFSLSLIVKVQIKRLIYYIQNKTRKKEIS